MSARYQQQIEKDLLCIRRILCEWDGEGRDYTLADVIEHFRALNENGDTVLSCLATLIGELKNDGRWGTGIEQLLRLPERIGHTTQAGRRKTCHGV